jgi:hypothetical protein
MSACLDSPGPFTMQPITATWSVSAPGYFAPSRPASAAAEVVLDAAGEFLEHGRGRPPAAGAGRHHRHEGAEAHHLQQLLRHHHLARAVAAGLGRQRHADRVADPLLATGSPSAAEEATMPLRAHPRLGEAEVERVGRCGARARRRRRSRSCTALTLADRMMRARGRPSLLGARRPTAAPSGRAPRASPRGPRLRRRRGDSVLVHQAGQQLDWSSEPQLPPIRTGLVVPRRDLDDLVANWLDPSWRRSRHCRG